MTQIGRATLHKTGRSAHDHLERCRLPDSVIVSPLHSVGSIETQYGEGRYRLRLSYSNPAEPEPK